MRIKSMLLSMAILFAACGGESATTVTTFEGTSSTAVAPATTSIQPSNTSVVTSAETSVESGGCADVVDVEVTATGDGTHRFDVTVESPDTGWEKYADAWEVRDLDGNVLGVRELTHPHVDEQPFTRSLSGVEIPDGIETVNVAARDSVEGYCGQEMAVELG